MTLPPPPMEWQLDSTCRDRKYAGLFDDPDRRNPNYEERRRLQKAMDLCHDCPVRAECLDFGLTPNKNNYGVFGGVLLRHGRPVSMVELFARGRKTDHAREAA